MTSFAARTIAALRSEHDDLAAAVAAFSPAQIEGPSGASDWTVAQVLSHVGSGAEINLAVLRGATGEAEAPGPGFNQSVWDRWNALTPEAQATASIESDAKLVAAFEALTPEQHEQLTVNPGFLPQAIPLASFAGMRLSEVVHHGWDVRVAADPAAPLAAVPAELLAEHLAGGLSFFLGFIAKTDQVNEPAVVEIARTPYRIVLNEGAHFTTEAAAATATFEGPLEAALRLLAGRLTPPHTPSDVKVTGNVTLDNLRAIFPGF
ncbi:maleylpyruvate isomerase N-terminal domain-containing protein [Paractinoplanes atraurantiacus]|uniref:TIGR03083 family protein n=1 Tax=Paractinoplanes atraurantiacus TaxID=1036182 RepID=A0A285HRC8_9ACTN|nr:maleylpyruvate isomerase N-terminal domain-containing protein [Actinoplanes atraurantiacus]SNY38247.1 TIGR03083 family protein [Actinoplanes atraurantiacus]